MLHVGTPCSWITRQATAFKTGRFREWVASPARMGVLTAEWSSDGKYLCTAGEDRYIKLWSIDRLSYDGNRSADLTFSVPPNNTIVMVAWPSEPGSVVQGSGATEKVSPPSKLLGAALGQSKVTVKTGSSRYTSACDGFATASSTGNVDLWDVRQSKPTVSFRLDHVPVALQFFTRNAGASTSGSSAASEHNLLAASASNTVAVYDPRHTGRPLTSHKCDVRLNTALVSCTPSHNQVFLGLEDGTVHVRNPFELSESLGEFKAHHGPCSALALDPMKRFIATGGLDSLVILYDLNEWMPFRTCRFDEDTPIRSLSFTSDGEFLSAASDSHLITTWSVDFGLPAFLMDSMNSVQFDRIRWHPSRQIAVCTAKRDRSGKFYLFTYLEKL